MTTQTEEIEKASGAEVNFFVPDTESLGKLKGMSENFNLTMKYKTADDWAAIKDKPLRAFFMGLKEIPNEEGELITCGVFVSQNEFFISGQKILVDAVRQLPVKTPVQVTYTGKKPNKSTEGATMIFDVVTLQS